MKNNFLKFIATSLAICTFASNISTFATNPTGSSELSATSSTSKPLETLSDSELTHYLNEITREFESLSPGMFFVDSDFKNPIKTNPYIAARLLTQAVKVFNLFPNITEKFKEQVQCTENRKFILKTMDEYHRQLTSSLFSDETTKATPLGLYEENTQEISIFIDVTMIPTAQKNYVNFHRQYPNSCATNVGAGTSHFIDCVITHEIGHLFESVIRFSKMDKQSYVSYLNKMSKLRLLGNILKDPQKKYSDGELNEKICKLLSISPLRTSEGKLDENDFDQKMDELYKNLKQPDIEIQKEIIDMAKTHNNYTGDGFISDYGSASPKEWFAETFSHAICIEEKHTGLDSAMCRYMFEFESSLLPSNEVSFKEFFELLESSMPKTENTEERKYITIDVGETKFCDKPTLTIAKIFRIHPIVPVSDHTYENKWLAKSVEEFENLAPGIFCVDPSFKNSKLEYPGLPKILNCITNVFKTYPNIKNKFIEQLQCTNKKTFTVKPFNNSEINMSLALNGTPPLSQYNEDSEEISLLLNCDFLLDMEHKITSLIDRKILDKNYSVTINSPDFIIANITRTMGMLINSVIFRHKNRALYRQHINFLNHFNQTLEECIFNSFSDEPEIPDIVGNFFDEPKKIYNNIKQEIIDMAKKEYGYTGSGFISQLEEVNSKIWFGEVFAHTMCCLDFTPLDRAMIKYLDAFEKSLC